MKRRFTKPWFGETDFFFKKTKPAFGRNHDFVKPWFGKLAPHFFKFPLQGLPIRVHTINDYTDSQAFETLYAV